MTLPLIGEGVRRTEARLKVTGRARYAAETWADRLAHAVAIQSTVARGRITSTDLAAAEAVPGMVVVVTHLTAPRLQQPKPVSMDGGQVAGTAGNVVPLQDDRVLFHGQHIGVLVAETLEAAQHAASLVRFAYAAEPAATSLEASLGRAVRPGKLFGESADSDIGDTDAALAVAPVTVEAEYFTPTEHHNPMEPSATVAEWVDDGLVVHDASQFVLGVQETMAAVFGLPLDRVRVVNEFLGGGFGCKRGIWGHVALAAMAAQAAGRPVKLVLTRKQMWTSVGYRSPLVQHLAIGAEADGRMTALRHEVIGQSSAENFLEPVARMSATMYSVPNIAIRQRVVHLDVGKPGVMRGPGNATGSFALESAMDELAEKLGMDPLTLRLRNHADVHPASGLPFSSKELRACYAAGADRFGWSRRDLRPGIMRDGRYLVGWGMASSSYPMARRPAEARVELREDGTAVVECGTQEIGQGANTVFRQVAAAALAVPVDRVAMRLGDTLLPRAPASAAAATTASVGPAVQKAALAALREVVALAARQPGSPLSGADPATAVGADGLVVAASLAGRGESWAAILRRAGRASISATAAAQPGDEGKRFAMYSHGAQFCEVRVDPELGEVRVSRFVAAYAGGRILNQRTAASQMRGGIVWGISIALHEDSRMDHRSGHYTNANLADYLVPVHADIPELDVIFVEEVDPHVNELGVKGIGELGIVGVASAVGNAVWHATGRRLRRLPIRPEMFL